MGCGEEWEEGEDAKSFQAEKSSTFKSCLDWHLGVCVGRAHAQPGWGFLGMSHIAGLQASPWTLTGSLQVSSPGSLQIARGQTTKYGSEIFVKEYFFFLLACNKLWKSRPRMSPTTTWKSWIWSTFTVAPGQHQGALSHLRGFPLAPRPSQWGSRVRRLILLLWNACSQAPAFLVLNLPSSGVCVSAPGSEHRAWNCISWARPPILFSKTSLLLSMAAAWKAALFWHDLHHPSSRLRTSCCSEGCFLSSLHLPSEAKHGRFFLFVCF